MLLPFSKILLGVGTVVGSGGIGLWATYETTKKTILDGLDGKRVVSTDATNKDASVWTTLLNKLKGADEPTPKSQVFLSLKNDSTSNKLEEKCKNIGNEIYSTIFSSDDPLLKDVENFCTIKIKEVLETGKLFAVTTDDSNTDKTALNTKLTTLKTHSDTEKGVLPNELSNLKERIKDISQIDVNQNHWKKLAKWCGEAYESSFFDKSEALWKQVDTYCKKG